MTAAGGHSSAAAFGAVVRLSLLFTFPVYERSSSADRPQGKMSDVGEENPGNMEVSAVQTVADSSVLQKHIRKLVPLLLEDGGEAPASLEAALEEKSSVEQMKKFLSDPQINSILVERTCLKGGSVCVSLELDALSGWIRLVDDSEACPPAAHKGQHAVMLSCWHAGV